jgi:dTDP-4-dehydrorhamnose reductase
MNKLKIIATGLSGLVGSRLQTLLKSDFDFIDFSLKNGVDLTKPKLLNQAFAKFQSADLVLNLAAFTDTASAWQQRGDKRGLCYRLNVDAVSYILDSCQRFHLPLIHFSTDFVFDGQKTTVYDETDTPDPIDWYGQTKFLAEQLIQKSNHPATILRLAFPFRSSFPDKKDLLRKIIDGFKSKTLYPVFTDQTITPTLIDDLAPALKHFFIHQDYGLYHLVGSSSHSPHQIALEIARVFSFDSDLVKKTTLKSYLAALSADGRPLAKNLALSNQKIKKLGITMNTFPDALLLVKKQIKSSKKI